MQISFAMSAWGEFAFVVAEAAGGELGIMDKDTQASVLLAVLLSVIIAPSCVLAPPVCLCWGGVGRLSLR